MQPLINVFIVGAMKAGTTYISDVLAQHTSICFTRPKETMYFTVASERSTRGYGPRVLVKALGHHAGEPLVCEGSTPNFSDQASPSLIHEHNPEATIVCVLRHPAARALSHYRHMVRDGRVATPAADFFRGNSPAKRVCIDASDYATNLQRYLDRFGWERVKIYFHEDLNSDRSAFIHKMLVDLGAPPSIDGINLDFRRNEAQTPANRHIQRLFFRNRFLLRAAKVVVPNGLYHPVRRAWQKLESLNVTPAGRAPDDTDLLHEVTQLFEDSIARTEDLLGTDLSRWRTPTLSRARRGST